MKKLICIALWAVCVWTVNAQSTNTVQTVPGFVNSVEQYFSSFNTNLPPFSQAHFEIATGFKQVPGANAASEIYAQGDLFTNFDIMANFQFSGIGTAINSAELGAGYALANYWDTKLQLDLLGGYDGTKADSHGHLGAGVFEPRLAVKKKGTANTYLETAISMPLYTVGRLNTVPAFFIGAGVTF